MNMTKKEYQQFKAKYELLGRLEDERQKTEYSDEKTFRRFLEFMDEIYLFSLKGKKIPPLLEDKLKTKIMVRNLLNRVTVL
ncbi:hypothetical protein H8E88_31435 [candidate division KSB1 bacterium]|nr:hypothetical protein [candidate division KSB1 bacterium]MBL7095096.1 hypothetical protein [candidate division KSB1 bacterium]